MCGSPEAQKGSSSFLQKRTKKLLSVKGYGGPGARARRPKFLLLFSKRSASFLPNLASAPDRQRAKTA
jgi:hypothetical protein